MHAIRSVGRSCLFVIYVFLQLGGEANAATSRLAAVYSGTTQFETYGQSLLTSGSEVLVGAPRWRTPEDTVGAILPLNLAAGLHSSPVPNPANVLNGFGYSMANGSSLLAVGAFQHHPGGGTVELFDLTSLAPVRTVLNPNPANDPEFGRSVTIVGDRLIVGVPSHDIGSATDAGRVDIFDLTTGAFQRSISNPLTLDNRFGEQLIPLDDRRVLVSSISLGRQLPGYVRIYDVQTGQLLQDIPPPDLMGRNGFGAGLAVANGKIYVGSYEGIPMPPAANFGGSVNEYDAATGSYRRSFARVLPLQNDNFGSVIAAVGPNLAVRSAYAPGETAPLAINIVDAVSGDVLDSIPNPNPSPVQTTLFGNSMVAVGSRLVVSNPAYAPPEGDGFARGGIFVYENLPRMLAYSHFDEAAAGALSFTPSPDQTEASFATVATGTGGANPLAGVGESMERRFGNALVHRSQTATTTFETVDLAGWHDVAVTIHLTIDATDYEASDYLWATVTNGSDTITLLDLVGGPQSASLNIAASEQIRHHRVDIPNDWEQVSLAVSSSTNSSTGAERIDFDYVLYQGVPDPAVAAFTAEIQPTAADVFFSIAEGDRMRTGLNLSGPNTLGYVAHPGERDSQLRAWFHVEGLSTEELNTLAIDLEFSADVLDAEVVSGGEGLLNANLMLTFAAGAAVGENGVVGFDFGPGAVVTAVAIPEPSSIMLVGTIALSILARSKRLIRRMPTGASCRSIRRRMFR